MNPSGIDANESVTDRLSGLPHHTRLQRYGLALLSVGVALGASLLLQHFGFRVPSALLLLFAVAISSWYGGPRAAVLAALLSITSFYWYFVEPVRTIYIYRSDIPYFIIFAAFAALLSWFGTVRRRTEKDLREQASLLNLTHDTVLAMDMEGVIKYWNRGAEERYGWTADQAVGRVVHDLLKTVFPAPLEEIKAEVTRTGRWEGELLHTKKDGSQLVAASRWSLERGKRGEPVAILETNNDITERKRAEEALRRLNRELRAISNCNQVLLRATDEQSLLEEICRIACEEAGYRMAWVAYAEHDEAKSVRPVAWTGAEEGYLASAGITWADTDRGRGHTGTAIRSGKSCCIQDFAMDPRMVPWREGLLQRDFRSGIALPLKDEQANAFGSLTIHSAQPNAFTSEEIRLLEELAGDMAFGIVTLRSRAARERAEQEVALLSFALDKVSDAAFLIDDRGRFQYVNEEACRVLGCARAELLDLGVTDIDPEFPEGRWSDHWRDLKAQRSLSFESRHRTRDGRIFPVEVSANYFEYAGRAYNLALVRDITERKRAEESLRESETRFRTFVDHAADAFFVHDQEHKVLDVNRQACENLGYTREELIGMDPFDFDPDIDAARLQQIRERLEAGEVCTFETRHRRKDGTVFPVELRLRSFWRDGRRLHLALVRDIADRKRAEAEIRTLNEQLIKAQEAERMRIAGELHDGVLQQITSLTLRLGMVKRQVPPDSEAKTTVSGLQEQLIKIGTDIRHISHELHPALLQEAGLPAALSAYCEEFSNARGLPVSCEAEESVKELSPGAALCLYRIAQEALGNAAKYSEAKQVEVRLTRSDGRVCLSVSDDGVGCAPDQIAKSGGLGLINMRERVLQLDGTFEFDSKPGHGATVRVTVPFRAASSNQGSRPSFGRQPG